ncbi:tRNA-dihydrouridine(16/17) synthase [NAD(P)(+)]-like [Chionoecetes opilio]|uniref:tRNA-dihydrouridine(16/17) synthase [NAD(P)(+)]-like n=1 Tax=Chionoecetes opilio TaxID=41210 RepID=A0A8J5CFZ6_CHIOP|nr:tRNA-dihydrouridine(16/17) synthase [NAD(P)(+)]-like [Chionoecetes opilio]
MSTESTVTSKVTAHEIKNLTHNLMDCDGGCEDHGVVGSQGGRCEHGLCRACCKVKCYTQGLDCPGHRILVKTKREKAAIYYGQQEKQKKKGKEKEGEAEEEDTGEKLPSPHNQTEVNHNNLADSLNHLADLTLPQQELPPPPSPPLTGEAAARESGKTDEPQGVAAEESIDSLLQEVPNGLQDDSPLSDEEEHTQGSASATPAT